MQGARAQDDDDDVRARDELEASRAMLSQIASLVGGLSRSCSRLRPRGSTS